MYIQGNLQKIFDALYQMGVIDPVLDMDWAEALEKIENHYSDLERVIQVVNTDSGDCEQLTSKLEQFDEVTLSYLAMEVAREYADYHAREEKLH